MQRQEELLLKQQRQKQELQQETRYDYPEEQPEVPNQRYDLPPEVNTQTLSRHMYASPPPSEI